MNEREVLAEGHARWASRPMFALDADLTVYWPDVRPCWEGWGDDDTERLGVPHVDR